MWTLVHNQYIAFVDKRQHAMTICFIHVPLFVFIHLDPFISRTKGTISKLLNELEAAGYLERTRTRGSDGRLSYSEYHVLIKPTQAKQPLNNQELILREQINHYVVSPS